MYITECKNGKKHEIAILPVEPIDFKSITKKEYFFDWRLEKKYKLYKLTIKDDPKILALASIEIISNEWRIHIRLLSVSAQNKGKNKLYDRIVGNLLTFISKLAIMEFAELACVSLKPKSAIAQHYIEYYGMNLTGSTLSLELSEILDLIKRYDI